MAAMSKEEVLAAAERMGIDISGMNWPQMLKTVTTAVREEQERKEALEKYGIGQTKESSAEKPVLKSKKKRGPSIDDYKGKTILISPEIAPTRNQLFKYDEEIGDDLDVEETHYNGVTLDSRNTDQASGTYVIKGKTGRKVVAQSTMPKQNAAITFRPDKDMFPVVTFQGRSGYLLTHSRLPNVKSTLKQSGYWEDYRKTFSDEPNIWYAAGKQLCADINLVHHVLEEIERKEKIKRNGQ